MCMSDNTLHSQSTVELRWSRCSRHSLREIARQIMESVGGSVSLRLEGNANPRKDLTPLREPDSLHCSATLTDPGSQALSGKVSDHIARTGDSLRDSTGVPPLQRRTLLGIVVARRLVRRRPMQSHPG